MRVIAARFAFGLGSLDVGSTVQLSNEDYITMIKEQVMRAIRFKGFGDPSVLELAEVAAPAVGATTALVRVMAASISPSDVKNVAGAMKQTTLPRIPGRDFAGVVEAGPADWI